MANSERYKVTPARFVAVWLLNGVTDERMTLAELVEEELLLAMPLVALHDQCPDPPPQSAGDPGAQDDNQSDPDNPFAVLARLKGRRK